MLIDCWERQVVPDSMTLADLHVAASGGSVVGTVFSNKVRGS